VANREGKPPHGEVDVTPRELRSVNLPLQSFGGYSRAETDRLLERAAGTLEETTSRFEAQISELRTVLVVARRGLEEDAAGVRPEDELAQTEADAQSMYEDGERGVAELLAEARRVRRVIDEFWKQWWDLISNALRQIELRAPSVDATADGPERLHNDLRTRVAETQEAEGIQSPPQRSRNFK
jgi:hypothetical protein